MKKAMTLVLSIASPFALRCSKASAHVRNDAYDPKRSLRWVAFDMCGIVTIWLARLDTRAVSSSAVRTKARLRSAAPPRIFAQTDLRNRTDDFVADLPEGALCSYALGAPWWDQEQGKSYSNDRSSSFRY